MAPKYNIYDVVVFSNIVYEIRGVYAMDWLYNETFVYGLIVYGSSPSEPLYGKMLIVREGLLQKATDRDIFVWEILYVKK